MANPQLLDYIRQQLAAGVTESEIHKLLTEQHWGEQEITGAFAAIEVEKLQQIPMAVPGAIPAQATPQVVATVSVQSSSVVWSKQILATNKGAFWTSVVLVFGLDLVILVMSGFSLFMFWAEMLLVFAIFCGFFYLEERVFKKKFLSSESKLDKWILSLVGLRNSFVVLNAIPGIQILGALALLYGIIPYLIIYGILIWQRSKHTPISV